MYIAKVAAIGVKFANRIRQPLTAPTATAQTNINRNPATIIVHGWPSFTKNDATTTRNPASGPTDKSTPDNRSAMVCPKPMKPSAVARIRML